MPSAPNRCNKTLIQATITVSTYSDYLLTQTRLLGAGAVYNLVPTRVIGTAEAGSEDFWAYHRGGALGGGVQRLLPRGRLVALHQLPDYFCRYDDAGRHKPRNGFEASTNRPPPSLTRAGGGCLLSGKNILGALHFSLVNYHAKSRFLSLRVSSQQTCLLSTIM